MISSVRGILENTYEESIVIDVHGIGYEIFVPAYIIGSLPKKGEEVYLHTYFHVREDAMLLFGFLTREELEIFKLLIRVGGVGVKAGISILSSIPVETLVFAILSEDIKTIEKANGIGLKTAKKIVLELKDKVSKIEVAKIEKPIVEENNSKNEAVEVLTALGYSLADATRAMNSIADEMNYTVEEIVRLALKELG